MPANPLAKQQIATAIKLIKSAGIAEVRASKQNALVVKHGDRTVEFWPSTGRWRLRQWGLGQGTVNNGGVDGLVAFLKETK